MSTCSSVVAQRGSRSSRLSRRSDVRNFTPKNASDEGADAAPELGGPWEVRRFRLRSDAGSAGCGSSGRACRRGEGRHARAHRCCRLPRACWLGPGAARPHPVRRGGLRPQRQRRRQRRSRLQRGAGGGRHDWCCCGCCCWGSSRASGCSCSGRRSSSGGGPGFGLWLLALLRTPSRPSAAAEAAAACACCSARGRARGRRGLLLLFRGALKGPQHDAHRSDAEDPRVRAGSGAAGGRKEGLRTQRGRRG